MNKKTQILEKLTRESIKASELKIWYEKLQVNMMAHTTTTGDYFIIFENKAIIIECKQVSCYDNNKAFVFSRVTQLPKLISFEKSSNMTYSFVLLSFQESKKLQSDYYLLPIKFFLNFSQNWKFKSVNRNDAKIEFEKYRIFVKNNNLDIFNSEFNRNFL